VRAVEHPAPLVAGSQGNLQVLENGNWVVGWGEVPTSRNTAPPGSSCSMRTFPPPMSPYRAYRFPWTGQPAGSPAVAYVPSPGAAGGGTLYASWNGATGVASWRVLAGPTPATLTPLSSRGQDGLRDGDLSLPASVAGENVAAQAPRRLGRVLGSSPAVRAP